MADFKYLIVGGGMTGDAAVQGIREVDPEGSIGMVSAEADPPYNRPPLTKGLWKGDDFESIWLKAAKSHADIRTGRRIQHLDVQARRATDDSGEVYTFEKLLLATGGTPRRLPFGDDAIVYYRTVSDYRRLRRFAENSRTFAVIGSGFIGSEIAAALALNGKSVVMVFPEESIGARIYPEGLSRFLTDYYREKGVELRPRAKVKALSSRGGRHVLELEGDGDNEIEVEVVVAGLGIQPNAELAEAAGLEVANGIVVDRFLRTSNPDVFAAGDVASFENPALGARLRVEHEDNARTMGRTAGLNMAGRPQPYDHLPSFYSDLFDLGYEAVGEIDSRLETFADWKEVNQEGVIYYLRDGRVRGVLLWNVWDQVDAARKLISEPGPFDARSLKGRLPEGAKS